MGDLERVGNRGTAYIATAKVAAKIIAILASAIISAVTAYRTATYEATIKVQSSKDKSEAGYQVTLKAIEALEHRILQLEQSQKDDHAAIKKAATRGRSRQAPAMAIPPTPSFSKTLPSNLDQAERQITRSAPSTPNPDAGTHQ